MPARATIDRFVKGFGFSVLCFVVWGSLAATRARSLLHDFSWMEALWLAYSGTISLLFLIRTKPSVVSLNPVHWFVALVTSFSGLFFERHSNGPVVAQLPGDILILIGLLGSASVAVALWRSYDFLPAVRQVRTGGLFRLIRHPMYSSAILLRLGYLAKHPSIYNAVLFVVLIWLYDRRARYEEKIMNGDPRYMEYAARVPQRFIPGVY